MLLLRFWHESDKFLVPVHFWCQPGSGVSTFLMPADFWLSAPFWCQHGFGVSRFLVAAHEELGRLGDPNGNSTVSQGLIELR
jgi:hypothetical protein